jgi:hypothetical protein
MQFIRIRIFRCRCKGFCLKPNKGIADSAMIPLYEAGQARTFTATTQAFLCLNSMKRLILFPVALLGALLSAQNSDAETVVRTREGIAVHTGNGTAVHTNYNWNNVYWHSHKYGYWNGQHGYWHVVNGKHVFVVVN